MGEIELRVVQARDRRRNRNPVFDLAHGVTSRDPTGLDPGMPDTLA